MRRVNVLPFFALGTALLLSAGRVTAQEQQVTREELDEIKGKLTSLDESATEYRGYVDAFRKIKVTGYIQTQWRLAQTMNQAYSIGSFSGGAFPTNVKNLFTVRRGRLKVTYDNVLTQYVLQIDAIQTGFTLKDAYVMVTEPWTQSFGLQMGVFDRPFGYEISFSSGSRETPERSRMYQTLFPGERELGGKLFYAPQSGPLSFLRMDVGVFNGSGPTANEYDNFKDLIGHLTAQFPIDAVNGGLDVGVSGYLGNVRNPANDRYVMGATATGAKAFVKESDTTFNGKGLPRTYMGIDAQLYVDVPSVGGLILRGEYIIGKQPSAKNSPTSFSAQPASALYLRKVSGFYAYAVQNIGSRNQLLVKYDVFDPNTDITGADITTAGGFDAADLKFSTLGLGFVHHWDDNVKFVFYYEMITNETVDKIKVPALALYGEDVRDNVFTFRIQVKF